MMIIILALKLGSVFLSFFEMLLVAKDKEHISVALVMDSL